MCKTIRWPLLVALASALLAPSFSLAKEQVFEGVLEKGDKTHSEQDAYVDYYEIEVEAGQLVVVSLEATGDDGFDTYLYVTGPSGQEFSNDDDYDDWEFDGSRVTFIAPETGEWEIEATGYDEDAEGEYEVVVNIETLESIFSERGELEEGDDILLKQGEYCDKFEVKVEAGKTYVVVATSSSIDTFLSIHYPGGLAINDDLGGDYSKSMVSFKPKKSGHATVVMTSSSAEEEGRYRLTVYKVVEDPDA